MVRAWNVPAEILDDKRLLGQHNEAAIMFSSIIRRKSTGLRQAYYNHPQTRRFHDNPGALVALHDSCVNTNRFNHQSPILDKHSPIEYMLAFPYGFTLLPHIPTQSEFISDMTKLYQRWGITGL